MRGKKAFTFGLLATILGFTLLLLSLDSTQAYAQTPTRNAQLLYYLS